MTKLSVAEMREHARPAILWVSPSLTLPYGSAGNHGFSSDRAIGGGVDGDRLLGKAVEGVRAPLSGGD